MCPLVNAVAGVWLAVSGYGLCHAVLLCSVQIQKTDEFHGSLTQPCLYLYKDWKQSVGSMSPRPQVQVTELDLLSSALWPRLSVCTFTEHSRGPCCFSALFLMFFCDVPCVPQPTLKWVPLLDHHKCYSLRYCNSQRWCKNKKPTTTKQGWIRTELNEI